MSHLPDQPHEVPFREVEHQDPSDSERDGYDYIVGFGKAEHSREWMTDAAVLAWEKELRRIEEARKRIGGFGFSAARVNG